VEKRAGVEGVPVNAEGVDNETAKAETAADNEAEVDGE
jgi:hypothetical protein